ncbi:MAG: ATP-binding cassette domain-containing protein, partial [Pseudomonadota bacterium]
VGSFMSFFSAMLLLMAPLKRLTDINAALQRGIAAGSSIFAVLDAPSEPRGGDRALERARGALEFREVSFAYSADKGQVLEALSFSVPEGHTVAFVGRSGSGKSTLVGLLPRFYDAQSGRVLLDGFDIRDYPLKDLRNQIAVVSQDITLFNDTVAGNIAYGALRGASPEAIREAARAAHVLEFTDKLPNGLDTLVGDRGVLLSGGQRQRIAIARALLKDAPVLILDEATSALDTESERRIKTALDGLMRNRTTLVIAHRLSTVESADRIVVLHQGRIVESGTHSELLAMRGSYAALYEMQFNERASGSAEDADGSVAAETMV